MTPSIRWVCFFTAHMDVGRRIHPLSVWGHSRWSRTLQLCLASSSNTLQTTGEGRLLLAFFSFSSLLSFSLLLSMCCTYLNPVVKCYNICQEIMRPFLSSLFHFILLLPIVPFLPPQCYIASTVLPCSLYPQNITDEEFHHESKWLYTCKPPLTHTHRCIVIACLSLSHQLQLAWRLEEEEVIKICRWVKGYWFCMHCRISQ